MQAAAKRVRYSAPASLAAVPSRCRHYSMASHHDEDYRAYLLSLLSTCMCIYVHPHRVAPERAFLKPVVIAALRPLCQLGYSRLGKATHNTPCLNGMSMCRDGFGSSLDDRRVVRPRDEQR